MAMSTRAMIRAGVWTRVVGLLGDMLVLLWDGAGWRRVMGSPSRFGHRQFARTNRHAARLPWSVLPSCAAVAVRHPEAGISDVEEEVHRLPSSDEHGVLPDEIRLGLAVAGEDQEAAGAMDVERMVRVHLVDQPQLDPIADLEPPADRTVLGTRRPDGEGERLVGCGAKERPDPLPLSRHVGAGARELELRRQRRDCPVFADGDRGERVASLAIAMLECDAARLVEEHVDDCPLRRREHYLVDELFAFTTAAVAADELHLGAVQADVEDTGVRGVGQVKAEHLSKARVERSDLPVLEQQVIEREQKLAIDRR